MPSDLPLLLPTFLPAVESMAKRKDIANGEHMSYWVPYLNLAETPRPQTLTPRPLPAGLAPPKKGTGTA